MKRIAMFFGLVAMALFLMGNKGGCDGDYTPQSTSGVKKAEVRVQTDANGHTTEQNNIGQRLVEDNKPGTIKHFYIISAYSGQVILYSTVRGKVTSSGKRLTPTTVTNNCNGGGCGIPVAIGDYTGTTNEVLQDDGAYGTSDPYIYWWDTKGQYYQYYITGGVLPILSDKPLAVKSVIINMEVTEKTAPTVP